MAMAENEAAVPFLPFDINKHDELTFFDNTQSDPKDYVKQSTNEWYEVTNGKSQHRTQLQWHSDRATANIIWITMKGKGTITRYKLTSSSTGNGSWLKVMLVKIVSQLMTGSTTTLVSEMVYEMCSCVYTRRFYSDCCMQSILLGYVTYMPGYIPRQSTRIVVVIVISLGIKDWLLCIYPVF